MTAFDFGEEQETVKTSRKRERETAEDGPEHLRM